MTPGRSEWARRRTERLIRVAMLGAVGAALAVVEATWPRPVPWMRLGLGNAAVVIAFWSDGGSAALGVLAIKVGLSGLIGGTILQPTTLVGTGAGVAAWAVMGLLWHGEKALSVGPFGVSVAGALAYGVAQVWAVSAWLARTPLWSWAPLVVGPGVIAGAVTGVVAALVLRRLGYWTPREIHRG